MGWRILGKLLCVCVCAWESETDKGRVNVYVHVWMLEAGFPDSSAALRSFSSAKSFTFPQQFPSLTQRKWIKANCFSPHRLSVRCTLKGPVSGVACLHFYPHYLEITHINTIPTLTIQRTPQCFYAVIHLGCYLPLAKCVLSSSTLQLWPGSVDKGWMLENELASHNLESDGQKSGK